MARGSEPAPRARPVHQDRASDWWALPVQCGLAVGLQTCQWPALRSGIASLDSDNLNAKPAWQAA